MGESQAIWRRNNPEKVRDTNRKSYYKHIEKRRKVGRENYYINRIDNINKTKIRVKLARLRKLEFIRQQKIGKLCVMCGEGNWILLDFHHRADKICKVCDGARKGWSERKLLEEISKCDIYCTSCHMEKHVVNDGKLKWLKEGKICSVCGDTRWRILQFHHRDPKEKLFTITTARGGRVALLAEVAKCDPLCPNDHRLVHMGNGGQ